MTDTQVVVAFAGDSGDGIQLIGEKLAESCALGGSDVVTYPEFPAEIRAPAGTLAGVSGFQVAFADHDIRTPGDSIDMLIALNPAALIKMLPSLSSQATIFIDADKFSEKDCAKLDFSLGDSRLAPHIVHSVNMTELTFESNKDFSLSRSAKRRAKNFFALGLVLEMFSRDSAPVKKWLTEKFSANSELAQMNIAALVAGMTYAQVTEALPSQSVGQADHFDSGTWRHVRGNEATSLAIIAAKYKAGRKVMVAGYPITPASDILHSVSQHADDNLIVFQAEDEMAAAGAILGSAFAGGIGITATSGPGMDLVGETIGLGVMAELPMVVIDVMRAGPSTGMPTKVEQSDLNLALNGRHGEASVPVIAAASPADCFNTLIEAVNMAQMAMTPVIMLSDAFIATSSEPWRVPHDSDIHFKQTSNGTKAFERSQNVPAWVSAGTPEGQFRVGGLEKTPDTGQISYCPDNHQAMTSLRQAKIDQLANEYPASETYGPDSGDILLVSWGSTQGAVYSAVDSLQRAGKAVSALHLRHLNPLPNDLGPIMKRFKQVLVPELNSGQLRNILRAKFLIDAKGINQVTGKPFTKAKLLKEINTHMEAVREKTI